MNKEEMKIKFWEEVLFVTPEEIKEDSIGIVSDDNVDSLIDKVRNETIDECLEILERHYCLNLGMIDHKAMEDVNELKELYDTTK